MPTATAHHRQFNRMARGGFSEGVRENMRAIGFLLLILASLALAFDVSTIVSGHGRFGFSGLADIWSGFDKASFDIVQQHILVKLGTGTWQYVMFPLLSLPAAALFGVPGVVMLRRYAPEIKLRAPTALEIEMMRMGIDPRKRTRRKY